MEKFATQLALQPLFSMNLSNDCGQKTFTTQAHSPSAIRSKAAETSFGELDPEFHPEAYV
jgi:hypothetical protein